MSASEEAAADPPLLEIRNLDLWFDTEQGRVHAVRGVSLDVRAGSTLGIVGESGCGKSVTCHSILRLTPGNGVMAGEIVFDGENLASFDEARLTKLRGREIAMIFQEPLSALNPVHTIGGQIGESLRLHQGMSADAAQAEVLRLLERVGIPEAKRRMHEYPHQLSGGMNHDGARRHDPGTNTRIAAGTAKRVRHGDHSGDARPRCGGRIRR